MGAASSQAYVDEHQHQKKGKVNTNIFLINFQFILDNLYTSHTGILSKCQKCSAYYNKYSYENVLNQSNLVDYQNNPKIQSLVQKVYQEHKLDLQLVLQDSTSAWVCEFCGFPNLLEGKMAHHTNEFIHLPGFFQKSNSQQAEKKEEQKQQEDKPPTYSGEQLIYVLDNSGSMASVETYIKNGETISLSRKKSIIASIEEQSISFMSGNQQKDVSLIIFSNEVELYTSIHHNPEIINGSCLQGWDQLVARVSGLDEKMVGVPAQQIEQLLSIYRKSNKMGSTALGPAALAAVEVAKSNRGSQVIICTDGMANTGLGEMGSQAQTKEASKFYSNLADYAKGKGVQISILGIGDEQMGMKEIGKLAEKTNGSVFKIDLSNLNQKLDNILSDKMVASDLKLKLFLNKNVKLDEEANDQLEVDVGNATRESCLTFEYLFTNPEQVKELKYIPFQAQVEYTDLNGDRQFIVVTKTIEITQDRKKVEDNLNIDIVEKRMAQKSANLIQQGDIKNANAYQQQWNDFIEDNSNYAAYVPQLQEQQQMVENIAKEGNNSENAQVKLQQMQKGKFWK